MIKDIIFFPFKLITMITKFILSLAGKMISAIIGLVLIIVGLILCATIIGMFIGIPLILIGVNLVLTALFR